MPTSQKSTSLKPRPQYILPNVSSIGPSFRKLRAGEGGCIRRLALRQRERFFSEEGPMLETLDYTIRIGSTPTVLYFDLYLYSAYAAHYVYYIYYLNYFS